MSESAWPHTEGPSDPTARHPPWAGWVQSGYFPQCNLLLSTALCLGEMVSAFEVKGSQ